MRVYLRVSTTAARFLWWFFAAGTDSNTASRQGVAASLLVHSLRHLVTDAVDKLFKCLHTKKIT